MTASLKTARLRPSPDCVTREIGGETVLLHLTRGTYYGLDATGTVIWRMLEEGSADSLDAVIAGVAERFGRAPDTIEQDIKTFLDDLHGNGLLLLDEAAP